MRTATARSVSGPAAAGLRGGGRRSTARTARALHARDGEVLEEPIQQQERRGLAAPRARPAAPQE